MLAAASGRHADGAPPAPHGRRALAYAAGLYAAWTFATWLLEGRTLVLLRPEAAGERVLYAVVANLLIGTVGALWLIGYLHRRWRHAEVIAGFGSGRRSVAAVAAGAVLGLAGYAAQGAPSTEPVVALNAFLQVLPVSVAEVLVCWAALGAQVESSLQRLPHPLGRLAAAVVASVAFGAYHLAHSPPFNAFEMVALLTMVGLATGAFFFVSRDVYGTVIFHNFLAVYGVLQALAAADRLTSLQQLQYPLLVMAVLSLAALTVAERRFVRRPARR